VVERTQHCPSTKLTQIVPPKIHFGLFFRNKATIFIVPFNANLESGKYGDLDLHNFMRPKWTKVTAHRCSEQRLSATKGEKLSQAEGESLTPAKVVLVTSEDASSAADRWPASPRTQETRHPSTHERRLVINNLQQSRVPLFTTPFSTFINTFISSFGQRELRRGRVGSPPKVDRPWKLAHEQ
jgi:hypothetical protein